MPADAMDHGAYVAAWFARAAEGHVDLTPDRLLGLLDRALAALWRRATSTLGEITLTAIVDRVLYTASENYPALAALKIHETGVSFAELRRHGAAMPDDLPQVVRFVLTEFLTVTGNLTDEILTPGLHAALVGLTIEEPGNGGGDDDAKRAR